MSGIVKLLLVLLILLTIPLRVYLQNCPSVDGNSISKLDASAGGSVTVTCSRGCGTKADWYLLVPDYNDYAMIHIIRPVVNNLSPPEKIQVEYDFNITLSFVESEATCTNSELKEFHLQIGNLSAAMNNTVVVCGAVDVSSTPAIYSYYPFVTVLVMPPPTDQTPANCSTTVRPICASCPPMPSAIASLHIPTPTGSPPTPSPVLSPEGTASLVGVVCFAFGILLGLAIGGLVGYCYKCVRVKQKLNKVASSKTPSSNGSG